MANDLSENRASTDASNGPESVLNLENEIYLSVQANIFSGADQSTFQSPGPSSLMDISPLNLPTRSAKFDRFGPTDCDGIHISSCGHAVHQHCHDLYLSSLRRR